MSHLLLLGIISGLVQIVGYGYYIVKTQRHDISPNPTTWLIFAFDTALLTLLEATAGASISLLLLPAACASGSIYVAWLIRKAGKLHWPSDPFDTYILYTGIVIAVSYTLAFSVSHLHLGPSNTLYAINLLFLILSNLNTFVAFVPIIREVYISPQDEHAGPWTIWTGAYTILAIATYFEVGFEIEHIILYAYPLSNILLHGTIAVLARDARKQVLYKYS